ncbi:hypothetical protein [Nocardioides litoris]|uniref:hypothetical protein n=1 Tax=Nocardioides litoris TaxID=1926648 RepID=UPI00112360C3|nr:hypothetical protein [Nocardioides litoris]
MSSQQPVRRFVVLVLVGLLAVTGAWGVAFSRATGGRDGPATGPTSPSCTTSVFQWLVPEVSIEQLEARHRSGTVRLVMDVAGLRHRTTTSASFTLRTPGRRWSVHVDSTEGTTWAGLAEMSPPRQVRRQAPAGPSDGHCVSYLDVGEVPVCPAPTGTVDVERGRVTAVVARSCLDDPAWVRVGGSVDVGPYGQSAGDVARPTLGPRVLAPAGPPG